MRIAEIIGTLSLATDAGTGMPEEHGLRAAVLAARLAAVAGFDERTRHDAYYVALLALAGCTAESHHMAATMGDEVAFGRATVGLDYGNARELMPALLRHVRRGKGIAGGVAAMAKTFGNLPGMARVGLAHCEVAVLMAGRFGFDAAFRAALFQAFERWDGSGHPRKAKGEAIATATRVAHVAVAVELAHVVGGIEAARAVTGKRAGRALDPRLCETFATRAAEVCAAIDGPSAWEAAMAAEPAPRRTLPAEGVADALRALGDFADLRSRFFVGHAGGVAACAAAGARALGLGAEQERTIEHAGLVHDLGRAAISAAIWDKATPLSDGDREQIRLHSYVGERVLARAPALAGAAEIATCAHERLDGKGYHRRLPAAACTTAARVLAAADVYRALTEPRPHRAARSADEAAAELGKMASQGLLCPDATRAILAGAGHAPSRGRPEHVAGLTDREVEVLRLVARGLTNKEIAVDLDISTKTAGHHLEHIFEKLGVSTRAAATMVALERGLAPR